ncbi:MAG: 30S ribosomal protein S6e [Candidatus Hydrothermarchaeaceae archaeon]
MKLVISDPKTGKAYNLELDESKERILVGLGLGKTIDASSLGLSGYTIMLTGGCDKDGFPMRRDIHGRVRQQVILSGPPGFNPKEHGLRKRKRLRGNVITPEIVQVNAKIIKAGKKSLAEILGQATEEQAAETAVEKKGKKK